MFSLASAAMCSWVRRSSYSKRAHNSVKHNRYVRRIGYLLVSEIRSRLLSLTAGAGAGALTIVIEPSTVANLLLLLPSAEIFRKGYKFH